MSNDIFQIVNMNAGDARKSFQWYKNQINSLGSSIAARDLLQKEKLTNTKKKKDH